MKINAVKLRITLGTKGMTQKELAKKAGVSRQTISCIASGKGCTAITACRIAKALDVRVEELMESEGGY